MPTKSEMLNPLGGFNLDSQTNKCLHIVPFFFIYLNMPFVFDGISASLKFPQGSIIV